VTDVIIRQYKNTKFGGSVCKFKKQKGTNTIAVRSEKYSATGL